MGKLNLKNNKKTNINNRENVQHQATKRFTDMNKKFYVLIAFKLTWLETSRKRADLIRFLRILYG